MMNWCEKVQKHACEYIKLILNKTAPPKKTPKKQTNKQTNPPPHKNTKKQKKTAKKELNK